MRFKIYTFCLIIAVLAATGCRRHFDSSGYVTSMMDTLYKGDYAAYAEFTGITTSEASRYRDQWLSGITDNFITMVGAGTPSDDTRERISELFKKIYANARYEVSAGDDAGAVQITITPMKLLTDNYESIQAYAADFNAKNDTYAFASLTDQEFYDAYLNGILTILESHLAGMSYGDAVQIDIALSQDESGLYTISPDILMTIQENILIWP